MPKPEILGNDKLQIVQDRFATLDFTELEALVGSGRMAKMKALLESVIALEVRTIYSGANHQKTKLMFIGPNGPIAGWFYRELFEALQDIVSSTHPYLAREMKLTGSVQRNTATFPIAAEVWLGAETNSSSSDLDIYIDGDAAGAQEFIDALNTQFNRLNTALPPELKLRDLELSFGAGIGDFFENPWQYAGL